MFGKSAYNFKDLTGMTFGMVTIMSLHHRKNKVLFWECKCNCGLIKIISGKDLKAGKIISCGCSKLGPNNKRFKNLVGLKFGKLEAVALDEYKESGVRKYYWLCRCLCGNEVSIRGENLKFGYTKSCGCIRMEILRNSKLTDEDRKRKRSERCIYKWRIEILERDFYTCQITGQSSGTLNIHHLYAWRDYPELRCDVNNGITLTEDIHKLFHKLYGSGSNTKEQFEEFRQRYLKGEFKDILENKN